MFKVVAWFGFHATWCLIALLLVGAGCSLSGLVGLVHMGGWSPCMSPNYSYHFVARARERERDGAGPIPG